MLKALLIISLFALAACDDSAAMANCQKTHSQEECFYALNR